MIRINLLPRAEARRQAARQRDAQVAVLIGIVLFGAIFVSELVTRRQATEVRQELDTHEEEVIQVNKKHQDAILLDKRRAELKAKLATIAALERQRTGPVHVLDDLSSATPEKLWLTDINESGGAITLNGKGLDNQTIASFMRNLSASQYFDNVDLVETKQVEDGLAKLKQFSIKARVVYAGRSAAEAPPAAADGGGENDAPPAEQAHRTKAAEPPAVDPSTPLVGSIAAERAARRAAQQSDERNQANDRSIQQAVNPPETKAKP
jgi:type IV pilus assembly protein PilN